MIAEVLTRSGVRDAKALIERSGLSFEEGADEICGLYDDTGTLVATGARAGGILKMLAVEPDLQGGAALGELVTFLVARGQAAGHDALFVYTKPEYAGSFEALNFSLLANQGKVALLEYGRGLPAWLERCPRVASPGVCGCVVMNCNPFTNGHRYLVETAAARVDTLYLFVVREDRSAFPFDVRYRLVVEGVRDLGNVVVLDTSRYIVSGATFPTYFLKKDDPVARIQMELDVLLFGTRIAPFFGIRHRFVGTEPCCPLTGGYNAAMMRLLPPLGIEVVEIERKRSDGDVISASRVRAMLAQADDADLGRYVPASTLAWLMSDEAEPVRRTIQAAAGARPN